MSQEEPAPPQEGAQLEDAQLEAIVPAAQAEEAVFDEDPHLYDDGSGDEGPSEKRMRGKNRELLTLTSRNVNHKASNAGS